MPWVLLGAEEEEPRGITREDPQKLGHPIQVGEKDNSSSEHNTKE